MIAHNEDPKFVFIHIPKTAGSSLREMVTEYFGNKNLTNWNLKQHTSASKLVSFLNKNGMHSDDYFKFSFVRNPWARVVSYYEYQFKTKLNFADFCKISKDHQLSYITNKKNEFMVDFVGKFENYESDCRYILNVLGIKEHSLLHINPTKHKHYTEYYTDETREIVAKNYANDIEYFGYDFRN
jgi:hypothetical protein